MNSEAEWTKALKESPDDKALQLAYADWLEEQGEQVRACQVREAAGAGSLVYSLWHRSWGKKHGEWPRLAHLKSHVIQSGSGGKYRRKYDDKWVSMDELVVVVDWRANPVEIARRPFSRDLRL